MLWRKLPFGRHGNMRETDFSTCLGISPAFVKFEHIFIGVNYFLVGMER